MDENPTYQASGITSELPGDSTTNRQRTASRLSSIHVSLSRRGGGSRNGGEQNQAHQIKCGGIHRCPHGPSQARRRQGIAQVDAKRGGRKTEDVGAIHHWLRQLPLQVRERAGGPYAGDRILA